MERVRALLAEVDALFVDEGRDLAGREAVDVGDRVLADEGVEARLDEGAFDLPAAERVRAVEDHHLDAELGAGAHHQAEGADEGVGAGADVLDVVDDDVEAAEHLRGRLAGRAVDGVDRQAGRLVAAALDLAAGVDVAADAVLRREQGDEVDFGGLEEDVDGALQVAVHPRGVREQADALALQAFEAALAEDFDAGLDGGGRGDLDGGGGLLAAAGEAAEQQGECVECGFSHKARRFCGRRPGRCGGGR